jgi:uncharacterized protein YceK
VRRPAGIPAPRLRPFGATVWGAAITASDRSDLLRSVLILSDKSSGSTILQNELAKHPDVNLCSWTVHQENETLYWCKAAALLGMPQAKMMDSTILPMPAARARAELTEFLQANLPGWAVPATDEGLIFEGWERLCDRYSPVFLEKSPHHLHSPSALSLLERASSNSAREMDIRAIGLVRNPIDTLYSMWKRWRTRPELRQREWVAAYENLRSFSQKLGNRMIVIRYEDLVNDPSTMSEVCRFIGVAPSEEVGSGIRAGSVSQWGKDRGFGFQPDESVVELAETFGYDRAELSPRRSPLWVATRETRVAQRRIRGLAGRARRNLAARDKT